MLDADFLTKNNMTLINDANKRCMKEYQDYLLQKRKPRLYMLKNGSKDFFLKKSMLEQIATVVMNYFHSKAGNA